MDQQGYLKYWILPEQDVNEGTAYAKHPVGNSPEVIPLDTSLFNDLDEGIERYVIYTSHLDTNIPNKFSLSTPARALSAFHCYWEGCPTSEYIKQDINKLTYNMKTIVKHQECVVPGLGNSGKRYNAKGSKSSNWGGKRK